MWNVCIDSGSYVFLFILLVHDSCGWTVYVHINMIGANYDNKVI